MHLANQGNPEPLLLARKVNRRLSVQNNQLNSNWAKVRDSLDTIRGFAEATMERGKSEMLKYHEKLKGNSGNLDISEISTANTPRRRTMSFSVAHEEAVKHTWLEKAGREIAAATPLCVERYFSASSYSQLGEKARFSKASELVPARASEDQRRIQRKTRSWRTFKNISDLLARRTFPEAKVNT